MTLHIFHLASSTSGKTWNREAGLPRLPPFPGHPLESNFVPAALIKYWTGHAKSSDGDVQQSVTDRYVKMAKDTKFRFHSAGDGRSFIETEMPSGPVFDLAPKCTQVASMCLEGVLT